MASTETIKNELPLAVQGELDVLMIDNFDSFTWNLYQQLCLLGANVTVIRNDALTPEQLHLLKISRLIISPGPGHPVTDSGISGEAIRYFTGKVPVLGVCMGLECIVDVFGGEIGYVKTISLQIIGLRVMKIRRGNYARQALSHSTRQSRMLQERASGNPIYALPLIIRLCKDLTRTTPNHLRVCR
jgi:GMP synthase-like glutamine amidotransferase